MFSRPIAYKISGNLCRAALIVLPALLVASCSTNGGAKPNVAVAGKPIDCTHSKDPACNRNRWADRAERDNKLDSSGSAPGYYGSTFGPRITW